MNSLFFSWFKVVLFFFFTSICKPYAFSSSSSSSSSSKVSYIDHCASIVPESTPTVRHHDSFLVPFRGGYYTGGDRLLPKKPSNTSFFGVGSYVRFRPSRNIYKTDIHGVYKLESYLYFRLPYSYYVNGSNSRSGSHDHRAARRVIGFSLSGFWSEVSRKLCMVGSAGWQDEEGKSLDLDAVLKLKIAGDNSSILTSLVSGSLESIYPPNDSRYFEPVSIYEFPYLSNYRYSLVSGNGGCDGDVSLEKNQSVSLDSSSFCTTFSSGILSFELKYPFQCKTSQDCDFLGGWRGYFPRFMLLRVIQCSTNDEGPRIRYMVTFGNSSYVDYYGRFDSNSTLIAEGSWDVNENRLCIAACRILNPANHWEKEVGDCSTRLSLRYPSFWTIRNHSDVIGHIWNNKTVGGSKKIEFRSWDDDILVPGLKYEYTELDRVRKLCPAKKAFKSHGKQYPSGDSYDMRFDMSVKHSKTEFAWGTARPLFVENEMYGQSGVIISDSTFVSENEDGFGIIGQADKKTNGSLSMSYKLSLSPLSLELGGWFSPLKQSINDRGQLEITAEGVYVAETGHLCMIGCRKLSSPTQESSSTSFDCEILVNLEFPPMTTQRGELIKGSIKSTRKKSDPLYFDDLSMTSNAYYASEAEESIWRMDLEITMALISNTFTCIFVGLQLFHVRKNPQVLSYISVIMVLILSIGHMIPLVLNFEAVFLGKHDKQTLFLSTGRWLEANEVTVRIVTMVAFLLEIRLLQLVWTARSSHENKESLWAGERKTALVSVPICVIGGLLTLLVNWTRKRYGYRVSLPRSLWGDLRSYIGLILDGFLLPQILLNVFCSSRESSLSRSFYVGTTVVQALPHGYDLYRGQTSVLFVNGTSEYYANPSADFYSTTWDVIIPCVGILLAAIIFLQQRLGGRWILPQRFREVELYQKVPVVDNQ